MVSILHTQLATLVGNPDTSPLALLLHLLDHRMYEFSVLDTCLSDTVQK